MEAATNFEDLTPELQEKAKACKSPAEVLALAQELGYELTDAELEGLSGGASWCSIVCGIVSCPNDCPDDYDSQY